MKYNGFMKKAELLPYLNRFITVTLRNGSEHTGYISNPQEIKKIGEDDDVRLRLLNGMLTDYVNLSDVLFVKLAEREETTQIPVISLKEGYQVDSSVKPTNKYADLFNEKMTMDEIYLTYFKYSGKLPEQELKELEKAFNEISSIVSKRELEEELRNIR